MKRFIFLLVVLLPCLVFGQKATITFEETSHNFGTVNENAGKAVHNFTFKNTGNAPLILTNVRAGCGCTTPEWSRQPIAPGATGNIKVSFDPRNRPGSFVKSITVNSNASNPVLSLTIRGKVNRKPAGPYDDYKFAVGLLKLTNNSLNLGAITHTQQLERNLEMVNTGNQTITITTSSPTPAITVSAIPATLEKGQRGNLQIKYDPQKRNDWGFVNDPIEVMVNNNEKGSIQVTATIQEDFSAYNGNYENAPLIALTETETTLPDLAPNTTYTHSFYIQNDGKTELIIRKIKPSDPNVLASMAKSELKPGKKTKVTITFKTDERKKTVKIIQFTTNDPRHSVVNYRLTGTLK